MKVIKIQQSKHRNSETVEHETLYHTGNHWATGILSKSLNNYLKKISRQHCIDSLQTTAIIGTSHITRKVLPSEV
jgi:hypothetical protein